ncbi:citrate transporter [Candidatus Kaiserbacteria bacterium RIFCSPHIGHO2_02_FULL_49_34]|uniref:Citrate transporter n=1 Tax=Candidatus Kaiserbacteria bacterium RIFCSPHIGHO2_02_FULL_49_34 TaxID=1798491 RepID=A0A1F6DIQ9_9BACT|nr:MAG: citrate transporter [Candidatus Kaiserbacteria bacterium RIFCSPHIGHO2_02_FULL_49_34]
MNIPLEFFLFGAILLGIAVFHHQNVRIAIYGMAIILIYKDMTQPSFEVMNHFTHEWRLIANLLGLLVGFEILTDHFRTSKVAERIPAFLPDDWKGGFVLLFIIWIMSTFLDNIAAAMIGASIATVVYRGHVTVGYLAAIVAASNAGGAGSVIGDTTTTMMWIDGVSLFDVMSAFLPAFVALVVFGIPLSIQQDKHHRITKDALIGAPIDYGSLVVVFLLLIGAVTANIYFDFPALGVWVVIIATMWYRKPNWHHAGKASVGAIFLLSLVLAASMMPVESLPAASPGVTFGLGFVSSVFDNIPLTKLALDQGGYDWGWLAYAVGFGGSMMWFGSSAGVAVSNDHPRIRNTKVFLRESWIIPIAYAIGFLSLYLIGWDPHLPHR